MVLGRYLVLEYLDPLGSWKRPCATGPPACAAGRGIAAAAAGSRRRLRFRSEHPGTGTNPEGSKVPKCLFL